MTTRNRRDARATGPIAVLRAWRPTHSRVASLLANAVITAVVVILTLLITPGVSSTTKWTCC